MDISLITGAIGALQSAVDIGKGAVGVRDARQIAEAVRSMNDQLLNAQERLLRHNAELLALQDDHFKATKKLAKVEEALADRARYALFDLGGGNLVLRADARPASSDTGAPVAAEPEHYACQPCFDGPAQRKVVMRQFGQSAGKRAGWQCVVCGNEVFFGERGAVRALRVSHSSAITRR